MQIEETYTSYDFNESRIRTRPGLIRRLMARVIDYQMIFIFFFVHRFSDRRIDHGKHALVHETGDWNPDSTADGHVFKFAICRIFHFVSFLRRTDSGEIHLCSTGYPPG